MYQKKRKTGNMCMYVCMYAYMSVLVYVYGCVCTSHWSTYNAVVGEEIPYEGQYKTSGSNRFADSCNINDFTPFACNVTTTCQADPLVVKCSRSKSKL